MAEVAPSALKWLGTRVSPDLKGVLSGIVGDKAHKRGYHRARNFVSSGDYSILLVEDKKGNGNHCSGIDMSFSPSLMKTMTGRLRDAVTRKDPRVQYIREFYGTVDGKNVFGRTHKGTSDLSWSSATSDKSHLWHIHISILRQYCDNKIVMEGILAVLMGKGLRLGDRVLRKGDNGSDVGQLQDALNSVNNAKLKKDNDFGPATETAVKNFQKSKKLVVDGVVGEATLKALVQPVPTKPAPVVNELEGYIMSLDRNTLFNYIWRTDYLTNPYADKATNPYIYPETALKNTAEDLAFLKTELVARDEADKVRQQATNTAIQTLADTLNGVVSGSGGSIDVAAIVARIDEASRQTHEKVADLQNKINELSAKLSASETENKNLQIRLSDALKAENV